MSGATLQQGAQNFDTIPPWPENRIKSFEVQGKAAPGKSRITEMLLATPAVANDEAALLNACLISDIGWWTGGILGLLRTLITMGYGTLAEARADHEAFKEVALARIQDTEKHIIKPFNLGLYFDAMRQFSNPVDMYPLQLGVAQLQAACQSHVLNDAKMLLDRAMPHLETSAKAHGKLAARADDVKRLRAELSALVAKLEKSKRASKALSEAAK